MTRKDALLRLRERLIAKRESLRRKLSDDLTQGLPSTAGGDVGDAANDGAQNELNSQLAALESRELNQIERAIELMREGRYGVCEICEEAIPITRLKALPFTPLCVACQRAQEARVPGDEDQDADWESAYEHEGRMSDKEFSLGDFDLAD
ncbi:MAG: TraR/DksA family transcriptional regulator [Planctomycetaceae bacterium]